MSPTQAAGNRLRRAPKPFTEITNKFFAPVLSAQLMTAPTGKPSDIRNFPPPTRVSVPDSIDYQLLVLAT